jgi:hypothetical protein
MYIKIKEAKMKRLAALCLVALLFCPPSALIVSCQQQPASTPIPKPAIASKTYINSEHGFSVEYPENWDLNEDISEEAKLNGIVAVFVGPVTAEYDQRVHIIIETDEFSSGVTSEEYAEAVEFQILKKNLTDYVKLEEQTATISEIPAIVRTFTATAPDYPRKDIQAYLTKENIGYAITYDVTPDSHDKYKDCFDLAVSTFKLERD